MIASLFVYWTLFESTLENLVITDYLLEELGFYSQSWDPTTIPKEWHYLRMASTTSNVWGFIQGSPYFLSTARIFVQLSCSTDLFNCLVQLIQGP